MRRYDPGAFRLAFRGLPRFRPENNISVRLGRKWFDRFHDADELLPMPVVLLDERGKPVSDGYITHVSYMPVRDLSARDIRRCVSHDARPVEDLIDVIAQLRAVYPSDTITPETYVSVLRFLKA